jgi:hypothetical protein
MVVEGKVGIEHGFIDTKVALSGLIEAGKVALALALIAGITYLGIKMTSSGTK